MFKTAQSLKQGYQLVYDWIFPQHKKMVVIIMSMSCILGVMFLLFSFNTYAKEKTLLNVSSDTKIDNISVSTTDPAPETVETHKFKSNEKNELVTVGTSIEVGVTCKEDDPNKFAQFDLYLDNKQIGGSTVNCKNKSTLLEITPDRPLQLQDDKQHELTLMFMTTNPKEVSGNVGERAYQIKDTKQKFDENIDDTTQGGYNND